MAREATIEDIFTKLSQEFNDGYILKSTATKAKDIYNRSNKEKIDYCMCRPVKRMMYAKTMLEWYEIQDR